MDDQLISIFIRLCIMGAFLLPMFPWPKPNYAPEHVKQSGQLFGFFILLVAAGMGTFLASLYQSAEKLTQPSLF